MEKDNSEILKDLLNEIKELTMKDSYKLVISDEAASITDSKLGGNPYLPLGQELPKNSKGEYMPLFVQINFNDVQLENYPSKGLLQLFIDVNANAVWPTEHKVRYYEDISKPSETSFPKLSLENFFVLEEIKLKLEKQTNYITINDYRFNKIFCKLAKKYFNVDIKGWLVIDDKVDINIDEIYDSFESDSGNVGGYPDFIQSDPREDDESHECYDECLIKVDTWLDDSRLQIGDSGIACLFIKKEDLINKNFDNTYFSWDCC